jgi:hypothetical protein
MNKEQKKIIDKIIAIFMYGIFLPFVLLALIAKGVDICMKYLFEKLFNPLYNKICKIVRGPIPNSVVHVKGKEYNIWHRVNEKLLTIKEAKALGKEYEDNGYEVTLHLNEF